MTIIGFIGKPRTGKTLLMVFMAYTNFINGHEIMANFTLKEPFKYTRMSPYDMLKIPYTVLDREKKTLLIQEADKWFNARRSMRNENTLLGGLTGQSGKRNMNIYWDTQFPHLVDNQLRLITDIVFHANIIVDNQTDKPLAFEYHREDIDGITKLAPIPAILMEPYYSMYDSYDPTSPMIQTKTMNEISEMINPDHEEKKRTRRKKNYE